MLEESCKMILASCMGVKNDETVVVVTDDKMQEIGKIFYDVAGEMCKESILLLMKERKSHGEEPPGIVAEAMKRADVLLLPTNKSLSHTLARMNASIFGARVASMPQITFDMLARVSCADFSQIERDSNMWAQILTDGTDVRVTSESGTDITFSIAKRDGFPDTGNYTIDGSCGNIPAGEAYIAPVEGSASGKVFFDGAMASVGLVETPIEAVFEKGIAVKICGGPEAKKLEEILSSFGNDARNLAELGIGTNNSAKITGNALEDEKVRGTIHLALGDNSTFGGKVSSPSHLDGIVMNPTLAVDGKTVIDKGQWLI
ncbi:MAG: aminopeptidase [Candidatus Methanofastidiosia archaeon]